MLLSTLSRNVLVTSSIDASTRVGKMLVAISIPVDPASGAITYSSLVPGFQCDDDQIRQRHYHALQLSVQQVSVSAPNLKLFYRPISIRHPVSCFSLCRTIGMERRVGRLRGSSSVETRQRASI